ncbi:ExeM/NucH family extracellular endonuclease [Sphaerospermopsis aphanizomenoides BCCUSP55]|uniref:ExeM/NucH family extracellular endonuclease n=1 Tax=Sphaerospermopsis aphanizomenoides TaxID=459663 RepID=UPI00190742BF|nr:ExeM/NucH family extracellular endonuclease [Sphaerospermopsis aphanizomenoides]MBK1988118.1 ExeM/NucH family extracellular endonuclease [Sphaerospermopsis aphanizomenoides BCCUSP55]
MAATTLTPGDIAIIGYTTNGSPDSFSFVNLVPISAGTIIYFTDNGWTGTGFRGSSATDGDGNENLIKFTANSDIAAGTVIRSIDTSANFTWTKTGQIGTTTSGSYNDLSLGQSGEQIAAFQSTNTSNPMNSGFTGIYQIDNTGTFENATSSSEGNVIPGLSQSSNTAVLFNNLATYAAFNLNTLSGGTKADWQAAINNAANWTFNNNGTSLPTGSISVSSSVTNTAPTIQADIINTVDDPEITTLFLNVSASSPSTNPATYISGVINDPTDPASTIGIEFDINDAETPNSLTITAVSSNQSVVADSNLVISGSGGDRNLKITPVGVGFADITVTVSDGTLTNSYIIKYAASEAGTTNSRFLTGTADASTAIAVDSQYMLVGDDENQVLRLYNRNNSGLAVAGFDFTSSLGLTDLSGGVPREVDIEASTRVGNRIFWMGSESNSDSGSSRPNRDRIFATDISGTGANTTLSYAGRYDFLKEDIIAWDVNNLHGKGTNYYGLAASAASGVGSKQGDGYNIEGLEMAPDHTTAYVAFRAPQEPTTNRTKALIVPVTNFTSLLSSTGGTQGFATFGAPIELDLGGRGIREIRKNTANQYIIIAGPAGDAGAAPNDFRLYTWTGNPIDAPVLRAADLTALNAGGSFESIVEVPNSLTDTSQIQILVDNGDKVWYNDGTIAKELTQNNFKKFRSDIVTIGAEVLSSPTVTIAATDADAAEANANPGTLRITRTGDTSSALTVNYTIATGVGQAANDGTDYNPNLTGTATIAANSSFVDITITPIDDLDVEGNETVTLTLNNNPSYTLGTNTTATVTIADNDSTSPPANLAPGDIIFNEYVSDNDANGNDFFELLVLKDNADLRGLRVSDNELVGGVLNNNESVFVFGNDSFLSNVPKGTVIAVWTATTGISTDTLVNPAANDWKMVLAPGTGVTTSVDGLGGSINTGLSTGGEALYLYLPGGDGNSSGTDNIYLDFISFESDGGDAPTGLVDLNLPSLADNAYYTGNTASGNDSASNWIRYDFPANTTNFPTPGDANPSQNLSDLRSGGTNTLNLSISPNTFSENAGVNAATATVTRTGDTTNALTVNLSSNDTSEVTVPTTVIIAAGQTSATFNVNAVDDAVVDGSQNVVIAANANNFVGATANITVTDNDFAIAKIHDIQGNGATFNTAFSGTQTIEGIVTRAFLGASQLNGFYVQEEDADADGDSTTSEAIFVYDPTGLFTGNVGDKVRVTGTVGEYTSTSSGVTSSLTQLSSITSVVDLGANVLPTVTNIQLPVTSVTDLESYEGMLVNLSAGTGSLTVTEHFQLGRFGQVLLSATGASNQSGTDGRLEQYTQFNAPSVSGYAAYLAEIAKREIILDDGSSTQNPDPILFGRNGQPLSASNTLRGGDTVDSITGILDQRFEGYRIQTSTGVNFTGTNSRPHTSPNVGGTLKVASFNVLNYFNGNGAGGGFPTPRGAENLTEFNRQRDKIIQAIINSGADVMGLMEMENDGYGSTSAIQDLVNGLNAIAGAGTYAFINPGTSLGTDQITVALIYKPGQVTFVGAAATMADGYGTGAFDVVGRKPLAQTFQQNSNGEQFTVVVNHFKSKGSSSGGVGDNDIGDGQGFSNGTRTRQAQDLAAWLATNPTGTTDSDYLIIGDLNAYAQENPLTTLATAGYNNLLPNTSYSYVFDGQWGSLDHALANSSLAAQVTGAEKWHINSDEPTVLDYNTNFKSVGQQTSLYNADQYRASDHDPVIIGLNLLSALPIISINNPSVTEGNSGTTSLTFTVSLDKASNLPVTVNYATVNGTAYSGYDYTAAGGTLTFAGEETTKVVNVAVIADLYHEGNETFQLQLSNPSNATINTGSGTGTIINDDAAPSLSINNISVAEGNSGTRFATFNVNLSTASGQTVTVNYATADGTATVADNDYTPTSGTLIFAPGSTLLTVSVPIVGDSQLESDESFYLNLSNVSGATLANSQGVVTILDNDAFTSVTLTGTSGKDTLTGGDGDDNIFGLDGNDTLNGGAGDDFINGGLGADILTGGSGADSFIHNNFNESLFANPDRIRDFNPGAGDRIILNNLPTAVFNAGIINSSNLSNAVVAAYSDADPTVAGSQVLGTNQAVFFSFGSSAATRRTYLSVNNNTQGFNASNDLFIEVTGLVGTLPTGALTASNYFDYFAI